MKLDPELLTHPLSSEDDLLDESQFITFCREYGVNIDTNYLRKLEKLKLILPISNNRILADKKDDIKPSTYSKIQMYPIYEVITIIPKSDFRDLPADELKQLLIKHYKNHQFNGLWRKFTKINLRELVETSDRDIYELLDVLEEKKYFHIVNRHLQEIIQRYYLIFELMNRLLPFWHRRNKRLNHALKKRIEIYTRDDVHMERLLPLSDYDAVRSTIDQQFLNENQIKVILEELGFLRDGKRITHSINGPHNTPLDHLIKMSFRIAELGSFYPRDGIAKYREARGRFTRHYLQFIDEQALIETEDPYKRLYFLNWLIYMAGGIHASVKGIILGLDEKKIIGKTCPYCNSNFHLGRMDQITCGAPACKQTHQNYIKRKNRALGRYS